MVAVAVAMVVGVVSVTAVVRRRRVVAVPVARVHHHGPVAVGGHRQHDAGGQ